MSPARPTEAPASINNAMQNVNAPARVTSAFHEL